MSLAERFRNFKELSEAQREARSHRYHFVNLPGKALKPILRDKFRPILKAAGFKRVSESLSIRPIESHYVHYLRVSFSSTFPGRFHVTSGIMLDFLPMSDGMAYEAKRNMYDSDFFFSKVLRLPNGNPEFDHGTNSTEAEETVEYLISCFERFDVEYFGKFRKFPKPLEKLEVPFIEDLHAAVCANSESEFGQYGATIEMFTYRLALVHQFLGNNSRCRKLLKYGLANYELLGLKLHYQQLLSETTG